MKTIQNIEMLDQDPGAAPAEPPAAAGGSAGGVCENRVIPDSEVFVKKIRRRFTAKYKLKVLNEADQCVKPGEIGALLRREGLYSSNLTCWRRQRDQGLLDAMSSKKRGRKRTDISPQIKEITRLKKENEKLQRELRKAERIIEFQKKISEILGISQKIAGNEGKSL